MQTLDIVLWATFIGLALGFIYILWSYAKGLKGSPRELWLLFVQKVVEYSAYGAMNTTFVLFLSADAGLSDMEAGTYIGFWSIALTLTLIAVGSVVDAIGIKRTLLIGTLCLLVGRLFLPLLTNIYALTILSFLPLAIGTAIMGPALSVGIKKYTTKEGAALGFALFYTLMNVGWAGGGLIFDKVRTIFGEHTMNEVPLLGVEMSTYQIIFVVSFLLTIPTLLMVLTMRVGVERQDDGEVTIVDIPMAGTGGPVAALAGSIKQASIDTVKIMGSVFRERAFWIFMFVLGILVFVRLTFYHFHYTFPKYGIRVLGEGVKIGNIYGVLNPMLIVFLTPLVAAFTRKISSYIMLAVGTFISAFSVFIAVIPAEKFAPLMDTWVGELIFVRWLEVPEPLRQPVFIALVIFIIIFTIGEAIWSPRLMQFTAEIAPKGREGTYIALSYLPYFAAKFIVGPLSGWLVARYTPESGWWTVAFHMPQELRYPEHYMVWIWVGTMAAVTPIGLVIFRRLVKQSEEANRAAERAEAEAKARAKAEAEAAGA